MKELVRSEYTENMPASAIEENTQDIMSMTADQQRAYAEALDPDNMGFLGKEGI